MQSLTKFFLKIPAYQAFYYFGWPPILPFNYTFSLTYQCNSHCRTCHIWQKKIGPELTSQNWQKIFLSLGQAPFWVTLSGGEPFLRPDLVEIVQSLAQICQPKLLTIPTNGLLPKVIIKKTKAMVKNCQGQIIVNLSLDGLGKNHDRIRGVKGNFNKTLETFMGLKKIEAKNFSLGVHTVISKENVNQFQGICDFVLSQMRPDSYITEIAENRVELGTMNKDITPKFKDYQAAINYLTSQQPVGQKALNRLIQAFRRVYYQQVLKTLTEKKQVIACLAGVASAQIAPEGDVWPCCVRAQVLGNLKKENFDFGKIWFSKKATDVRQSIKKRKCSCPLANVAYSNMFLNPGTWSKMMINFWPR